MNERDQWQECNARYLSTALAWLRASLERVVNGEPGPLLPPPPAPVPAEKNFWRQFLGRSDAPILLAPHRLPAGPYAADEHVSRAAAELANAASQCNPPAALIAMGRLLGLSTFEQNVLLLCIGMELDTGIASLCARAQGDSARTYPTFALAFTIFDEPAWEALSPERPLRYWRLLEINQPNGQFLTTSPLRADERIVNFAKGLNYLDDRLIPLLTSLRTAGDTTPLPASQESVVATIVANLQQPVPGQPLPVIQLLGSDTASKQLIASRAASSLQLELYRLPAALLPGSPSELESLARLWQRESRLLPVALYVDTQSASENTSQTAGSALSRLIDRLDGVIFLDTREVWHGLSRGSWSEEVAKPTAAEQAVAWQAALSDLAGENPSELAAQFNLNLTTLQQVAQQALSKRPANQEATHKLLWDTCLANTSPRLDALAQRVEPKATWDDIVLPFAENCLLHEIAEQVCGRSTVYEKWGFARRMSRGLGISALFAGESGTGKTMAAEVLANYLRLNLYRIDLSAVVSKYIGETEKNLRRLFDAAEDGGAILFFDEADALFGKRSEVKDSHDRYANIEINYLLQRMEAYRGLAILATNMKSALDTAFMRRLRFVVNFPFPGLPERRAIWQRVFPDDVPRSQLDWDRLARLNLTGGHIHNIALNAAFRAAHAGEPVTMPLVLEAARTELRKLERPINELDFRRQPKQGAVA